MVALDGLIAVVAAVASALMFGISSVADQRSMKRVEPGGRCRPGSWWIWSGSRCG